MVWLGDVVIRYCYRKLRHLWFSPSEVPTVQFQRNGNSGEESVSLLLDEGTTTAANDNNDDDDDDDIVNDNSQHVTSSIELLEHDQLY